MTMRMPTLRPFGEGCMSGEAIDARALARSAGVVGTARRKGGSGNRGRPVVGEGSGLNVATGGRLGRESDRVIRPLKLGNTGGAKDPDLYGAFDVNLFSISYSFSHLIYSHLTEVRFWTFRGELAVRHGSSRRILVFGGSMRPEP